jgi:DNA-binding PadR family transcriptional regulator
MQAVAQSAGPSFPAGPGTVYGSLQRMEEDGLVRELPSRGDERRRVFALQPEGRRALETESRRIVRLAQIVRAKRLASGEA